MAEPIDIVPGAIERPRLTSLLDQRWERSVITIVAGAGFGKSTLLSQVLAGTPEHGRHDHLVRLDAACAPASTMAARIAGAVGLDTADPDAVVPALGELNAAHCLLFDDVHTVDPDSGGMRLLRRLVAAPPPGVSVVAASRRPIPAPLARARAAGRVLDLDEHDLGYTTAEVTALASAAGTDPTLLADVERWPALVSLVLSTGHRGALEFLVEEVVDQLDDKSSRALIVATLAGSADAALLREVAGFDGDPVALAAAVPMVAVGNDLTITPHHLWAPVIDQRVFPDDRSSILQQIAEFRRAAGDHRGALQAAARAGASSAFADVVRDIAQMGHVALHIDEIDRWLRLAPDAFAATTEGRLLRALSLRAADPFGDEARDALTAVCEETRASGDVGSEVVALSELTMVHRSRGDSAALLPIVGRLFELDAAGHPAAKALAAFARAVVAEQQGDVDGAMEILDGFRRGDLSDGWMALIEFQRGNHLLLLGRPREALEAARRSEALGSPGFVGGWSGVRGTTWHLGVTPEAVEALPVVDEMGTENPLDRLWSGSWFGAMQSFAGDLDRAARNIAHARDALRRNSQPELEGFVRWAEAAYAVADGEPDRAAALTREFFERHPIDSPTGSRIAARSPALFALLLGDDTIERLRAVLGGPWQHRMLDTADALRRGRSGEPIGALADPGEIMCALPLPWAAELAALARSEGAAGADDLVTRIRAVSGAAGDRALDAAVALVGAAPLGIGRAAAITVRLLGPVDVVASTPLAGLDELRRRRVRELLTRIAVDGPVRREVLAETIWPGASPDASSRNLRANLTYLGRIRDPDGDRIVTETAQGLCLRDGVGVDLVRFDRWVGDARTAARAGAVRTALDQYHRALDLVRGSSLDDTRSESWFELEASRIDVRIGVAAVDAAELASSADDPALALEGAELALRLDPYHEAAHRLRIDALIGLDDLARAGTAADEASAALAALGVEVAPDTRASIDRASTRPPR